MRSNVAPITNHFYAASPRFKGEDGKPMAWEICCISADEYARIRAACIKQVPIPGKKNQYTQNDWGVAKPEELLGKMLIGGEFDDYMTEVFQVNGFKTEDELVDDAKN